MAQELHEALEKLALAREEKLKKLAENLRATPAGSTPALGQALSAAASESNSAALVERNKGQFARRIADFIRGLKKEGLVEPTLDDYGQAMSEISLRPQVPGSRAEIIPSAIQVFLDFKARKITIAERKPVHLTDPDLRLLELLLKTPADFVPTAALAKAAYQLSQNPSEKQRNRVMALMANLRGRIEPDPKRPTYILSEKGKGYRFGRDKNAFQIKLVEGRTALLSIEEAAQYCDTNSARIKRVIAEKKLKKDVHYVYAGFPRKTLLTEAGVEFIMSGELDLLEVNGELKTWPTFTQQESAWAAERFSRLLPETIIKRGYPKDQAPTLIAYQKDWSEEWMGFMTLISQYPTNRALADYLNQDILKAKALGVSVEKKLLAIAKDLQMASKRYDPRGKYSDPTVFSIVSLLGNVNPGQRENLVKLAMTTRLDYDLDPEGYIVGVSKAE